ncbi:MAG: HEAT repeat domain-containing protein [Bauldia sp.]|nr:HEAT repeat domain-containing protein [Bauldia sp.]
MEDLPLRDAILARLSGGDRRSIAKAPEALDLVLADPASVASLVSLTRHESWLVRMRALDLLEKLAHRRRELVEPYRDVFLGPAAEAEQWEVRLQVVRALPLFDWSPAERKRAVAILRENADHPQTFVRAWATDGLARFAESDEALRPLVDRLVAAMAASGRKSLMSRARAITARRHAADSDSAD